MDRVQLLSANLTDAVFDYSELDSVIFQHTTLKNTSFKNCLLHHCDFSRVDVRGCDFTGARIRGCFFTKANLSGMNLSNIDFHGSSFAGADLTGSNLDSSKFPVCSFTETKLINCSLNKTDLTYSNFARTDISNAKFTEVKVYGLAAWDVIGEPSDQSNLIITDTAGGSDIITVDNIQVAQFIYLLLNNKNIRQVISTITSKAVLILGRFSPERKAVLDAIREELRKNNYLPILFDFDKPESRDLTETVATLAHMSRFVIADITEPKSIPQELATIIPGAPSLPIQPIILDTEHEYSMFEHFQRYPWVLDVYRYTDNADIISQLQQKVIAPAEAYISQEESKRVRS